MRSCSRSSPTQLAHALSLATTLAAGGVGCDRAPTQTTRVRTIRDSAGIRVIVYDSAAVRAVPEWEVGVAPLVRYGARDDSMDILFRVVDAEFVATGIAIADAGNARIKLYSRRGEIRHLHGSRGEGPGEYQSIVGLQRRGDTLLVLDTRNSRITLLDSTMETIRTQPITLPNGTGIARVVGVLDDGGIIVGENVMLSRDAVGQVDLEFPLHRVAGSNVTDLGLFALAPRFITRTESGVGIDIVPVYANPSFDVAGQRLYFADGRGPELRILNDSGGIETIVRWGLPPPPVTDSDLKDLLAEQLSTRTEESAQRRVRRRFEEMVMPDSWPAVQSLTTDALGRVWVRLHAPPDGELQQWLVVDGDEIVGRLALAEEANVLTANAEELVLRVVDELDVEIVEVRQLRASQ